MEHSYEIIICWPHRQQVCLLLFFFSADVALFIHESDVDVTMIFQCVLPIPTD